jgi:hypothetical protein
LPPVGYRRRSGSMPLVSTSPPFASIKVSSILSTQ